MPSIFDIAVPKLSRHSFLENLNRNWDTINKQTLYFLDTQRVLLSNYFQNYKDVSGRATYRFIEESEIVWALSRVQSDHYSGELYSNFVRVLLPQLRANPNLDRLISPIRYLIFYTLFIWAGLVNLISFIYCILAKPPLEQKLELEKVPSSNLVWDILQFAHKEKLKVAVIGGSEGTEALTSELINTLFPDVNIVSWCKPSLSNLISDIPKHDGTIMEPNAILSEFYNPNRKTLAKKLFGVLLQLLKLTLPRYGKYLNSDNITVYFPDLYEAENFLENQQADIILLCLGGETGKQEYFADRIKSNTKINFKLLVATGGDLEFDQITPVNPGLAGKLAKMKISLPQVFKRLKQTFTLIWWTTLQQFTDYLEFRPTVVCNLINPNGDYLLVKRAECLPGDFGWTFVQGGIELGEEVKNAAIREVKEEAGLDLNQIEIINIDNDYSEDVYPLSLVRFLVLGAMYQGAQAYVATMKTTEVTDPKTDHENLAGGWFKKNEVFTQLSPEKRIYFRKLE